MKQILHVLLAFLAVAIFSCNSEQEEEVLPSPLVTVEGQAMESDTLKITFHEFSDDVTYHLHYWYDNALNRTKEEVFVSKNTKHVIFFLKDEEATGAPLKVLWYEAYVNGKKISEGMLY